MWGYRTTETAKGLPSLLQHIYLRPFQYIYLNFVHSTVTRKWKLLFVFGYTCISSNCKVVSRWLKRINIPGDALGMNGLQGKSVRIRTFGPSGEWRRVCVSGVLKCRTVLPSCSRDKVPSNLHGVMSPKPKVSLRKYTVSWPPARVQLFPCCCSEQPGHSQFACCHSRTQQGVSRSHKQEDGLQ